MTFSKSDAQINLRIFDVNANGEPDNDLLNKNFLVSIKKGKKINYIDLHKKINVPFPVTGIFIGFEFLIIKENKFIPRSYYDQKLKKVIRNNGEVFGYMPAIGEVKSKNQYSWEYRKGRWYKRSSLQDISDQSEFAIELTIVN